MFRRPAPLSLFRLGLLAVAVAWGGAFVAIKELDRTVSAATITLLRFALTSATVAPILLLRGGPRIAARDRWRVALLAVLGVGAYHLSLNYGEHFVSASVASLIVAS